MSIRDWWKRSKHAKRENDDPDRARVSLAFRMSKAGMVVVMDVFGSPRHSTYFSDVASFYKMAQRQSLERGGSVASTPFALTVCTHCKTQILTNRDPTLAFNCAACHRKTALTALQSADAKEILRKVDEALGVARISGKTCTFVLVVQPKNVEFAATAEAMCRDAGFGPLPEVRRTFAALSLRKAIDRQLLDKAKPFKLFEREMTVESAYDGQTPPEIARLAEALHRADPGLRSLSFEVPAESSDPMHLMVRGDFGAALDIVNRQLLGDTQNADLLRFKAQLLLLLRRVDEAEQLTRMIVEIDPNNSNAWTVRGQVAEGKKDTKLAITCYERVLELDPTDTHAMELLSLIHEKAGSAERAEQYRTRLRSLGGYYSAS